jgi:hypothetical protein
MTTINALFTVKKGRGEYREKLNSGKTPLVTAKNTNNGVIDFVDIEPTFKAPAITVERVSGQAFVQLLDFATVPDDMSVLIPRTEMSISKLFFIASEINLSKWKFNYGRKLTLKRLKNIETDPSKFEESDLNLVNRLPCPPKKVNLKHNTDYQFFNVVELFNMKKGDFHALDKLDEGCIPTVSRVSDDNGITGYYEIPEDAELYEKGLITVSTVSGDAFVQLTNFMATDNVLICTPKKQLNITTLFFILLMINLQKWRFSYGRQPYKRIFSKTKIFMPMKNGEIDEDYIEKLVKNCYGWDIIEKQLNLSHDS